MELKDELNHIKNEIEKLNRSQVPTGIISLPIYNPLDYNYTAGKPEGRSMSYLDLQRNMAGLKFGIIDNTFHLPDYFHLIKNARKDAIEMCILHVSYNRIKEDDKTIQDVENKGEIENFDFSAYFKNAEIDEETLFSCLPLRERVADGSAVEFRFNSDLIFDNTSQGNPIIEFDAGDGNGFTEIERDTAIQVSYAEKGLKQLRVNVHYGDQIFESVSTLEVIQVGLPKPDRAFELTAGHYYNGTWAKGDVKIYYANKEKKLVKPLYFWAGFNTGTSATSIMSTPFDMMDTSGVELFSYNYERLLKVALDNGYDIVMLEWKNSRDYIQNNGFLAATLIKRINTDYPKCANGVIVTGSMGGLIARWTTVYMEQEEGRRLYGSHKLKKLITLDTPHEGAVMPMAMQYSVDYMADRIPFGWGEPARKGREVLTSPAASQMLVQQFRPWWDSQNAPKPSPERVKFLKYWTDWKPYPQELEMYAVSNGSKTGEGQMNADRSATLQPAGLLLSGRKTVVGAPVLWVDQIKASPSYTRTTEPGVDITQIAFAGRKRWNARVKKSLPYDSCPGGNWDFISSIGNALNSDVKMPFPRTNFIPALSSVGLVNDNLYKKVDINYPGAFKAIYMPDHNEPHASLNPGNTAWIMDVLGIKS